MADAPAMEAASNVTTVAVRLRSFKLSLDEVQAAKMSHNGDWLSLESKDTSLRIYCVPLSCYLEWKLAGVSSYEWYEGPLEAPYRTSRVQGLCVVLNDGTVGFYDLRVENLSSEKAEFRLKIVSRTLSPKKIKKLFQERLETDVQGWDVAGVSCWPYRIIIVTRQPVGVIQFHIHGTKHEGFDIDNAHILKACKYMPDYANVWTLDAGIRESKPRGTNYGKLISISFSKAYIAGLVADSSVLLWDWKGNVVVFAPVSQISQAMPAVIDSRMKPCGISLFPDEEKVILFYNHGWVTILNLGWRSGSRISEERMWTISEYLLGNSKLKGQFAEEEESEDIDELSLLDSLCVSLAREEAKARPSSALAHRRPWHAPPHACNPLTRKSNDKKMDYNTWTKTEASAEFVLDAPALDSGSGHGPICILRVPAKPVSTTVPWFSHLYACVVAQDDKTQDSKEMKKLLMISHGRRRRQAINVDNCHATVSLHVFKEKWLPLATRAPWRRRASPHVVTERGIFAIVTDQPESRILENLDTFSCGRPQTEAPLEEYSSFESIKSLQTDFNWEVKETEETLIGPPMQLSLTIENICDLNGWNLHRAKMRNLRKALQMRDLRTVQASLVDLQKPDPRYPWQELKGCSMLMNHISYAVSKQASFSDRYLNHLLAIGVGYTSYLIRRHSQQLLDDHQTKSGLAVSQLITAAVFRRLRADGQKDGQKEQHPPDPIEYSRDSGMHIVDLIVHLSGILDRLRPLQAEILNLGSNHKPLRLEGTPRSKNQSLGENRNEIRPSISSTNLPLLQSFGVSRPASISQLRNNILHGESKSESKSHKHSVLADSAKLKNNLWIGPESIAWHSFKLEVDAVVKDAILSGRLSAAITHLHILGFGSITTSPYGYPQIIDDTKSFKPPKSSSTKDSKSMDNSKEGKNSRTSLLSLAPGHLSTYLLSMTPLQYIVRHAGRLIYHVLCNDQMDFLAMCCRLLRVFGENEIAFLKHIAMTTCRRSLREKLLSHLSHAYLGMWRETVSNRKKRLLQFSSVSSQVMEWGIPLYENNTGLLSSERNLHSYMAILEQTYPNSCYFSAYNRMHSLFLSQRFERSSQESTNINFDVKTVDRKKYGRVNSLLASDRVQNLSEDDWWRFEIGYRIGWYAQSCELVDPWLGVMSDPFNKSCDSMQDSSQKELSTDNEMNSDDEWLSDDSQEDTSKAKLMEKAETDHIEGKHVQKQEKQQQPNSKSEWPAEGKLKSSLANRQELRMYKESGIPFEWRTGDVDDLQSNPLFLRSFTRDDVPPTNTFNPRGSLQSKLIYSLAPTISVDSGDGSTSEAMGSQGSEREKSVLRSDSCWLCQNLPGLEKPQLSFGKSHGCGYLHVSLAWIKEWDSETRYRVLLERLGTRPLGIGTEEDIEVKQPLASLQSRSLLYVRSIAKRVGIFQGGDVGLAIGAADAELGYFVGRNDWRSAIAWVRRLPLHHGKVDQYGRLQIADNGMANPLLASVNRIIEKHMIFASDFLSQAIVGELASRGIFLSRDLPEIDELNNSRNPKFDRLMTRLTESSRLFNDHTKEKGEGSCVDLSELLPMNKLSPFHIYVLTNIRCANLIQAYCHFYQLTDFAAITSLESVIWPELEVEILIRQKRYFFASLVQARTLNKASGPVTVHQLFKQGYSLAALGALMCLPTTEDKEGIPSTTNTLSQGEVKSEGLATVQLRLLRSYVDPRYRELARALYSRPPTRARMLSPSERTRGDFRTLRGDLSLFQLLRLSVGFEAVRPGVTPLWTINVDKVFSGLEEPLLFGSVGSTGAGNDSQTPKDTKEITNTTNTTRLRWTLPHFTHPALKQKAIVDEEEGLDYAHYLRLGQPMMAYHAFYAQMLAQNPISNPLGSKKDPKVRLEDAPGVAVQVALEALGQRRIEVACVAFLQLCGVDPSPFRIVIESAKCVYNLFLTEILKGGKNKSMDEARVKSLDRTRELYLPLTRAELHDGSVRYFPKEHLAIVDVLEKFCEICGKVYANSKDFSKMYEFPALLVAANISSIKRFMFECESKHAPKVAALYCAPTPYIGVGENGYLGKWRVFDLLIAFHVLSGHLVFTIPAQAASVGHPLAPSKSEDLLSAAERMVSHAEILGVPVHSLVHLALALPQNPYRSIVLVFLRLLQSREVHTSALVRDLVLSQDWEIQSSTRARLSNAKDISENDVDILLLSAGARTLPRLSRTLISLSKDSCKPLLAILAVDPIMAISRKQDSKTMAKTSTAQYISSFSYDGFVSGIAQSDDEFMDSPREDAEWIAREIQQEQRAWQLVKVSSSFCAYVHSSSTYIGKVAREHGAKSTELGLAVTIAAMICTPSDIPALRHALLIFDPDTPIISLVEFVLAFETERYSDCCGHLSKLSRDLRNALKKNKDVKVNYEDASQVEVPLFGELIGHFPVIVVHLIIKTVMYLLLKTTSRLKNKLERTSEEDTGIRNTWKRSGDMPKRRRNLSAKLKPFNRPPAPPRRKLTHLQAFRVSELLRAMQEAKLFDSLSDIVALSLHTQRQAQENASDAQRGSGRQREVFEGDPEVAFASTDDPGASNARKAEHTQNSELVARVISSIEEKQGLPNTFLADMIDLADPSFALNRLLNVSSRAFDDLNISALTFARRNTDRKSKSNPGSSSPLAINYPNLFSQDMEDINSNRQSRMVKASNEDPDVEKEAELSLMANLTHFKAQIKTNLLKFNKNDKKQSINHSNVKKYARNRVKGDGVRLEAFGVCLCGPEDMVLFGDENLGSGLHPVVEEALVVKKELRESFLWDFPNERMAFWRECALEFKRARVSPHQRTLFFSQQLSLHEHTLTTDESLLLSKYLHKYERSQRSGNSPSISQSESNDVLSNPPLKNDQKLIHLLHGNSSSSQRMSSSARNKRAMELAHWEVSRVLSSSAHQLPEVKNLMASDFFPGLEKDENIRLTDVLLGRLILENSNETSPLKAIRSGVMSYLKRTSISNTKKNSTPRDLALIATALKVATTPSGASLPPDLPYHIVQLLCRRNPMLGSISGNGLSSSINRSLVLDQITRLGWFAQSTLRRLHVLFDVSSFLDWTFSDTARLLEIHGQNNDAKYAITSSLQGPYLLLRNILAVQRSRGQLTLTIRKKPRKSKKGSKSQPWSNLPIAFSPSQELFRRFVESFELNVETVADVIAESFMSPTAWRTGVARLESEIAYLLGFVESSQLRVLGKAFENLVGDTRLFPHKHRKDARGSQFGRNSRQTNKNASLWPLKVCSEIQALSYAHCCYFHAQSIEGVARTTSGLQQRLPTLTKLAASYYVHRGGDVSVLRSSTGSDDSGETSGNSSSTSSSTGESLCGMLVRCMALLGTREYILAESVFSSLLIPSRQTRRTKNSSDRAMVAPLFAARTARSRGGRSMSGRIEATPQAMQILDEILKAVGNEAEEVLRAHLDEYLDGFSLPDEEAMMSILAFFHKYRFLGRFYLQKGTARVSQSASSSYKHLSTSLQILLEAAQHFSRGGAYNHCLTSLELAALLKQRMAKLHSASSSRRRSGGA